MTVAPHDIKQKVLVEDRTSFFTAYQYIWNKKNMI